MWSLIQSICQGNICTLNLTSMHVDVEPAMHIAVFSTSPNARIECCRFHLGQAWWRHIQKVGLNMEYRIKTSEIGKWLSRFFGLPFLPPEQVADAFAEDIMSDAPDSDKCSAFADYAVETYISDHVRYSPHLWASSPNMDTKRTNNGPEAFHSHFNGVLFNTSSYIRFSRCTFETTNRNLYQN